MPKVPKDVEPVKDRSLLFALWDNERASLAAADGSEYLQSVIERLAEQVEELQGAVEKLTEVTDIIKGLLQAEASKK